MKKNALFLCMLILLFTITVSAQPALPITKLIPGDAQWVVHLDVQKLLSTEFGNWLLNGTKFNKFKKINNVLREKFKIDPLHDLMSVTAVGIGKGEHEAVIFINGKMDKKHLLGFLDLDPNHNQSPYGKYTIHGWGGGELGVFAKDNLLMIGHSELAIKHALDVLDGKRQNMTASKLLTYWREIPRDAFLSAAAHNISSLVHDKEASVIMKKTGMALFLALEKKEILKLALKLNTDSPETAQNIKQLVMGFIALGNMKLNDPKDKHHQLFRLLQDIKVNQTGHIVQMELAYPSKELKMIFSPYISKEIH